MDEKQYQALANILAAQRNAAMDEAARLALQVNQLQQEVAKFTESKHKPDFSQ